MLPYTSMLSYRGIKKSYIGIVLFDIVWSLDLHLPMQLVPITTKVVSSNPAKAAGVLDTTLCDKVCQ